MRFTIDFDPTSATGVTSSTATLGQGSTERNTDAGLPQSGLDAGSFSAVLETQSGTTERPGQTVTSDSNLNAGASAFSQTQARSPGDSRERNVLSIANPPAPHSDDFGLATVPKKSQARANAGSFKG